MRAFTHTLENIVLGGYEMPHAEQVEMRLSQFVHEAPLVRGASQPCGSGEKDEVQYSVELVTSSLFFNCRYCRL